MAATKVSDTRGGPTAVLMTTDDGEREEVFATRWQAELFLFYIPMMALISDEFAAVRSAILSPLQTAAGPQASAASRN